MYYVYVLYSCNDRARYVGYTANLHNRILEHEKGESFYTKSRGPYTLVYYEAYVHRKTAKKREKFLKSGRGREYLSKILVDSIQGICGLS